MQWRAGVVGTAGGVPARYARKFIVCVVLPQRVRRGGGCRPEGEVEGRCGAAAGIERFRNTLLRHE